MKTIVVENKAYNSMVENAEEFGMNVEKKVVECGMFIIPNQLCTPQTVGWINPEAWDMFKQDQESYLEKFGLSAEDCMVQVWAINGDCDNFTDHFEEFAEKILGAPSEEMPRDATPEWYGLMRKIKFPGHLPYSILKDLEEGDTLVLNMYGTIEFRIKVEQLKHRYMEYGRFEECLKLLEKSM